MPRGFFGVGIENCKSGANLGTLWRSANIFGASFIFTTHKRYSSQCSDTLNTPKHIPLTHYDDFDDFYRHLPYNCLLIGVELGEGCESLQRFHHPERAVYLLGAEDTGLSAKAIAKCHRLIQIPSIKEISLNVSTAGSIILYDRYSKGLK